MSSEPGLSRGGKVAPEKGMERVKEVRLTDIHGLPTDLALVGDDAQTILVATSEGHLLLYETENWTILLVTQVCKGSIRRICVHDTLCFVAPTKGGLLLGRLRPESGHLKLVSVKASKKEQVTSEQISKEEREEFKLGTINAFAYDPRTNHLYLGMEDGDVHFGRLEIEGPSLQILHTYNHHDDYISDLYMSSVKKIILIASGDGTMSVVDTKKRAIVASTKNFEEDVSALAYVSGNKVILGTSMGSLKEFRWNYWGAPSGSVKAKIHGHASINKIVEVDNGSSVVTAADDGCLRLCSLKPFGDQVQVIFERKGDPIQGLVSLPPPMGSEESAGQGARGHVVCIPSAEASLFVITLIGPDRGSSRKVDETAARQTSGPPCSGESSEEEEIPKRKGKKARHTDENPFPGLD